MTNPQPTRRSASRHAYPGPQRARTVLVVAAVLFGSGSTLFAQNETAAALDRFLRDHLAAIPNPGFSAVVVKGDRVLLSKGYGVEVKGRARAMTDRSPVAIGSQTKSFTAVAVMQLVEQGRIELDAPVVRYLPWFRTADRRGREITVRMLLHNTSGIPSQDRWLFSRDTSETAIEKEVRGLSSVPIVRTPGESFEYSNENWSVAGAIISTVSGLPYSEYLDRHVFRPLGMQRSSTALARFAEIGALWGHYSGPTAVRPAEPRFLAVALPSGSELRVSAGDMGNYLRMLLQGGTYRGTRVLSDSSVRELFRAGSYTTISMPEMGVLEGRTGYGMGWVLTEVDGRTIVQHGGDAIVMGSWTAIDTANRVAASLFYNGPTLDAYRFPTKVWVVNNLLHIAAGEPKTDFGLPREGDPTANDYQLPAELMERYTGTYVSSSGPRLMVWRPPTGRLLARLTGGDLLVDYEIDFASEASAVLRNLSGGLVSRFLLTPGGRVTGLAGGVPGGPFRKRTSNELARTRVVNSPAGRLGFQLPRGWQVEWDADRFRAHDPEHTSTSIQGGIANAGWDEIAAMTRGALSATAAGTLHERTETVGRFVWQELIWTEPVGDTRRQRILAYTEDGGQRFDISVTTALGHLTPAVRDVLVPLMSSLELRRALAHP